MTGAKGFSLVEMLVTMAVLAVALGIAVPEMTSMVRTYKINSAASLLASTMALARSEAIKRGASVVVCRSSDGATCATSGDWAQGWVVYVTSGQPIRSYEGLGDSFTSVGSGGLASSVSYLPSGGTSLAATETITICNPGHSSKVVEIVPSGRVRVSRGALCA